MRMGYTTGLEEAAKDVHAAAPANADQAGVVKQGFVQVVPQKPADAEPVGDGGHEVALRANALEKQHQLEVKEHDGIHGWAPADFETDDLASALAARGFRVEMLLLPWVMSRTSRV